MNPLDSILSAMGASLTNEKDESEALFSEYFWPGSKCSLTFFFYIDFF